jgi:hypothetical protein
MPGRRRLQGCSKEKKRGAVGVHRFDPAAPQHAAGHAGVELVSRLLAEHLQEMLRPLVALGQGRIDFGGIEQDQVQLGLLSRRIAWSRRSAK